MRAARAQCLTFDAELDPCTRRRLEPARLIDVSRRHIGIRPRPASPIPSELEFTRFCHTLGNRIRRVARGELEKLVSLDALYRALKVDPIDHRPAEPALVAVLGPRLARAALQLIAVVAARARIRGGDQLEPGRIRDRPARANDADDPVFERLAKRLQRLATELGELVQEQNATMRERYLSRMRHAAPATDQSR